ncbi:YraN family protein [Rickettsiales bacterium LUAb2]
MVKNSYIIGKDGEVLAVKYLRSKKYVVIAVNYKVKVGEIDIITKYKNTLIAVEVKARKDCAILPYCISHQQKIRIKNAFLDFLSKNIEYSSYDLRFDAIFIDQNTKKIDHLENIWVD